MQRGPVACDVLRAAIFREKPLLPDKIIRSAVPERSLDHTRMFLLKPK